VGGVSIIVDRVETYCYNTSIATKEYVMINFMTPTEVLTLRSIKAKVMAGMYVSDNDKQWVIDMLAKCKAKTDARVVARAKAAGFNVEGVVTF
jgi:hypothetical protein